MGARREFLLGVGGGVEGEGPQAHDTQPRGAVAAGQDEAVAVGAAAVLLRGRYPLCSVATVVRNSPWRQERYLST